MTKKDACSSILDVLVGEVTVTTDQLTVTVMAQINERGCDDGFLMLRVWKFRV